METLKVLKTKDFAVLNNFVIENVDLIEQLINSGKYNVVYYEELGRKSSLSGKYFLNGYFDETTYSYFAEDEIHQIYTDEEIEKLYHGYLLEEEYSKEKLTESQLNGDDALLYYTEWEECKY